MEINRGLPACHLLKYFTRYGDEWEVAMELRAMCRFQRGNLSHALPALDRYDAILMRNVLFYFSEATQERILQKMHTALKPDKISHSRVERAALAARSLATCARRSCLPLQAKLEPRRWHPSRDVHLNREAVFCLLRLSGGEAANNGEREGRCGRSRCVAALPSGYSGMVSRRVRQTHCAAASRLAGYRAR